MKVISIITFFLGQIITLCAAENDVLSAPALFMSYNLVPKLKSSLTHNEQLPFTESEVNNILKDALKQCLNDHYIFVQIPGLKVSDFQNFTVWHHLRLRSSQSSTLLSMPHIIDSQGLESQEFFGDFGNVGMHSVINWNKLRDVLKSNCHIDEYDVENMDSEEVPNFIDANKKLINIEVPEALLYFNETEERQQFLLKVDELIRKICMKFPSPRVGVILASTTSNPADHRYLLNREDNIQFDQIPDDPKVLSRGLMEKVRKSTRFIFPDITVFDKSRYYEYERNEKWERPRLSDLKDKQWAKDGDKNVVDMDEDDTWLERKEKKIIKDENLYKYGENEDRFKSVFEDRQFIIDNAFWIAGGVLLLVAFITWDFVKFLLRTIFLFVNKITPRKDTTNNTNGTKKEEKSE